MSLEKLPTEIDAGVVQYLHDDTLALAALSRTSRNYLRLSEPLLYNTILFNTGDGHRIKRLLLALLSRKKLAGYIQKFVLTDEVRPRRSTSAEIDREVQKALKPFHGEVMRLFKQWTGEAFPQHLADRWLDKIFLKARGDYDGALALILCLSINLETVQFFLTSRNALKYTRKIMRLGSSPVWIYEHEGNFRPFQMLRTFSVEAVQSYNSVTYQSEPAYLSSKLSLQIESAMESVHYSKCYISDFSSQICRHSTLRTLRLNDLTIDRITLENAIGSPAFRSLRKLHLERLKSITPYDTFLSRILSAIQLHLPHLEVLGCAHILSTSGDDHDVTCQAIRGMEFLKELRIDYSMFYPRAAPDFSPAPWPKTLHRLELTNVTTIDIFSIYWQFFEPSRDRVANQSAAITNTVASSNVKHLVFDVLVDRSIWMPGEDEIFAAYTSDCRCWNMRKNSVDVLRMSADRLWDQGIVLELRYEGLAHVNKKVMIGPGCTAYCPHFKVLTARSGSEGARLGDYVRLHWE